MLERLKCMRLAAKFCISFLVVLFLIPVVVYSEGLSQRGLFIWSLEDRPVLSSKSQIEDAVNFAKKHGVKILFVQIYRANQAWFPSKIADSTPYQICYKNISQDPLELLIKKAHEKGIEVHAWINLLSLSANKNAMILKKYGTSILTRNVQKKKTLDDYKIDNQFFLEPSDFHVRQYSLNLIEEILKSYPDLDGIQFDYIRYPDVHPFYGYSPTNVKRFKKATGLKSFTESSPQWKQWKRDQVTEFLQMLVKKVRFIRPNIHISTTGCLAYSRAYYEALQDWSTWINTGLIEFVTLMNYPPDAETYEKNIVDIKLHLKDLTKVNMAVGAYKEEQTLEAFKGQFDYCEKSALRACVLFHYDSLIKKPDFQKELDSH